MEPNEDGGQNGQLKSVAAPNVVEAEPEEGNVNGFRISPFLMPPVLWCILRHVKTPDLKGLRRTSSLWNQMTLYEMEQRAINGEYRQWGFDWNRNLKTRRIGRRSIWARKSFWNFFHQTKTRPNLFRSFYLHFPDAPLVLNRRHFSKFFVNYKPCIVNLALKRDFVFTDNARNLLREFTRWVAPTLRELTISNHIDDLVLPPIADQGDFDGIVFRNLKKLILYDDRIRIIPVCPRLTSLDISANYCRPSTVHLFMNANLEYFALFNLISLPITFPRLSRLSIFNRNPTTMALFQKNVEPLERTHLKIFEFHGIRSFYGIPDTQWTEEDNTALFNNFSSVDSVKIQS